MRPHNTSTPLGRRIQELGLRTYEVAAACRISPRLLTEYLAGRRRITPMNRALLARYLSMDVEDVQPSDHSSVG
jgi:hypothetical protein